MEDFWKIENFKKTCFEANFFVDSEIYLTFIIDHQDIWYCSIFPNFFPPAHCAWMTAPLTIGSHQNVFVQTDTFGGNSLTSPLTGLIQWVLIPTSTVDQKKNWTYLAIDTTECTFVCLGFCYSSFRHRMWTHWRQLMHATTPPPTFLWQMPHFQ